MSRYIDADALLEILPSIEDEYKFCRKIISEQPTADVVEVVRCEHCLHWDDEKDGVYVGNLYHCCDYDGEHKDPCDFCSYGERRTE